MLSEREQMCFQYGVIRAYSEDYQREGKLKTSDEARGIEMKALLQSLKEHKTITFKPENKQKFLQWFREMIEYTERLNYETGVIAEKQHA